MTLRKTLQKLFELGSPEEIQKVSSSLVVGDKIIRRMQEQLFLAKQDLRMDRALPTGKNFLYEDERSDSPPTSITWDCRR
ncbi:hypothetical protein TNCV_3439901 [Trichonephila clavipes]|nr:hypothetical protein TNCV_3439901 [Trichonephila clavipes]